MANPRLEMVKSIIHHPITLPIPVSLQIPSLSHSHSIRLPLLKEQPCIRKVHYHTGKINPTNPKHNSQTNTPTPTLFQSLAHVLCQPLLARHIDSLGQTLGLFNNLLTRLLQTSGCELLDEVDVEGESVETAVAQLRLTSLPRLQRFP